MVAPSCEPENDYLCARERHLGNEDLVVAEQTPDTARGLSAGTSEPMYLRHPDRIQWATMVREPGRVPAGNARQLVEGQAVDMACTSL